MNSADKIKSNNNNLQEDDVLGRVAALSAVMAYIESDDNDAIGISDKYSGWGAASLLEGVGEKPLRNHSDLKVKKSLWNSFVVLFVFLGLSSASVGQELDYPQKENLLSPQNSFLCKASLDESFHDLNNLQLEKDNQIHVQRQNRQNRQPRNDIRNGANFYGESRSRIYRPFQPGVKKEVFELRQPHAYMYDRVAPGSIDKQIQSLNQHERINGTLGKSLYVRVGLVSGASKIEFDTLDGAKIYDLSNNKLIAQVKPEGRFLLTARRNRGGGDYLVVSAKNAVDKQFFVSGAQLERDIQKVSFTPKIVPMVSHLVGNQRRAGRYNKSLLSVLLKPGQLPEQYYSGRRSVDPTLSSSNTNLKGILITSDNSNGDHSNSAFSINGRAYRGNLLITPQVVKKRRGVKLVLNAINIIDVEDYLLSTLPSEMPPGWPMEALKAQAIASRSYVLANLGKYKARFYDVKPSVFDQVYKGVAKERAKSNRAVAETRGIVLKHEGKIIPAFFHSTSGGHTEVSQHVWSKELPYLNAVRDFDHTSPHSNWTKAFDSASLKQKFKLNVGEIMAIFVIDRSPSRRVRNLLVIGSKGGQLIRGVEARNLLKLPSTKFNLVCTDNGYKFKGQGFGHGLGLSQWGAYALAKKGYNAAQILKYYYKDVTFGQIFEETAI